MGLGRSGRARGRHLVEVSEQIVINRDPGFVWGLAWSPSTSVLLDEDVVRAFTVPGTPEGCLGEQQCTVVRQADGTQVATILEVVELDPGRRAVARNVSVAHLYRSTTLVLPAHPTGCVVRLTTETQTAALGASEVTEHIRAYTIRYLSGLKALAEAAGAPG